jgi:hypothetical protein
LSKRKGINPFYILLVVLGISFTLTACGYGVLMVRAVRPAGGDTSPAGTALLAFLDRHGEWLMTIELVLLAVATFGAIASDRYWMSKEWRRWQESHPALKEADGERK